MTEQAPAAEWTAYCAPGRKPVVSILALLGDGHVTEVIEHPWLEGRGDYLLVNAAALGDFTDPPAQLAEPLPRCLMCGGTVTHYSWCYLMKPLPLSLTCTA